MLVGSLGQFTEGTAPNAGASQLAEFVATFSRGDFATRILQQAYAGVLRTSLIRSVSWRMLLGLLPYERENNVEVDRSNTSLLESWQRFLQEKRAEYKLRKERFFHRQAELEGDPAVHNPLNESSDNVFWQQYFKQREVEKLVLKDLARLDLGAIEVLPVYKEIMKPILQLWAAENPEVSYRQGMHEILAVLLVSCLRDTAVASLPSEVPEHHLPYRGVLTSLLDVDAVEADVFNLFTALLTRYRLQDWYRDEAECAAAGQSASEFAVVAQCRRAQGSPYLSSFAPVLAQHLQTQQVEAQVYGMRWLRLLFFREFTLDNCMVIWDAIFSDIYTRGTLVPVVSWFAASMLKFVEADLLSADYNGCVKRLMRFPPAHDASVLVTEALLRAHPEGEVRSFVEHLRLRQEEGHEPVHEAPQDQEEHKPRNPLDALAGVTGFALSKKKKKKSVVRETVVTSVSPKGSGPVVPTAIKKEPEPKRAPVRSIFADSDDEPDEVEAEKLEQRRRLDALLSGAADEDEGDDEEDEDEDDEPGEPAPEPARSISIAVEVTDPLRATRVLFDTERDPLSQSPTAAVPIPERGVVAKERLPFPSSPPEQRLLHCSPSTVASPMSTRDASSTGSTPNPTPPGSHPLASLELEDP